MDVKGVMVMAEVNHICIHENELEFVIISKLLPLPLKA
jgi:hypothetical protein